MNSTSYTNLARKYRPQTINDIIGQDALIQTLKNAFTLNRIANAFMFTGTRGVGKTTTARIIAKALNCIGKDGLGNITLHPCGVCEQCISITEDRNLDVIEIDAASKTSVDDIRDVIENAKYKPVVARYKIFIIDEVHMLSKSAFNALLKTLEEPAPHVKFIFATTELRKVPITILSRCQKFDLKRINTNTLVNHLISICNKETIKFDQSSLHIIAKAASGSVRDALSLLDQAIAYSNNNLTEDKLNHMLGNKNTIDLYTFFDLITDKQDKVLYFINEIYNQGISLDIFFEDLQNICHNITVYKITKSANLLDINDFELEQIKTLANKIEISTLLHIWQILLKGSKEIKQNYNTLQVANMLATKLILANNLNNTDFIINKILTNTNAITNKAINTETLQSKQDYNNPKNAVDKSNDVPWKLPENTNLVSNIENPSNKHIIEKPTVSINNENLIKQEVNKVFPKAVFKGYSTS